MSDQLVRQPKCARGVAASDQFPSGSLPSENQYTKWRFIENSLQSITLVLWASWAIADCRKTKGRGRPLGSFRVSFRRSHEGSFEASFELSNQTSFDASFRLSFEASDERSDALSFETSDARCDVTSFEVSDGRSFEVSFRVSILRYFPANSEASFLASFQGSFQRSVDGCFEHPSDQFAGRSGGECPSAPVF